jgi:hypothetical protein
MYLRTDEEHQVADAMDFAAQLALDAAKDLHRWRWIILALHNAAQGAMVLSLRRGNGLLALSDKSCRLWMAAYENSDDLPLERLDSYLNLYKKVTHRSHGQIGGNTRFVPEGAEEGHIKRVNSIRNDFIHFTPKGWSLEVTGLPGICLSTARLISFLALETTNVRWDNGDERSRLQDAHSKFTESMRQLHTIYKKNAS